MYAIASPNVAKSPVDGGKRYATVLIERSPLIYKNSNKNAQDPLAAERSHMREVPDMGAAMFQHVCLLRKIAPWCYRGVNHNGRDG